MKCALFSLLRGKANRQGKKTPKTGFAKSRGDSDTESVSYEVLVEI